MKKSILTLAILATVPVFSFANDVMTGSDEFNFKNVGDKLVSIGSNTTVNVPVQEQSAGIHASVVGKGNRSDVTLVGNNLTLNLNSENIWQAGIDSFGGANLTIGTEVEKLDSLKIIGASKTYLMGALQAWRGHSFKNDNGTITDNTQENGGHINIHARLFEVDVTAPSAVGIYVWNNTTPATLGSKERSSVIVNADTINMDVKSTSSDSASRPSRAIQAWSQGIVKLNANNMYISADELINTRGDAIVEINAKTGVLKGDVVFAFSKPDSGTPVDATVNINLDGQNSSWTGNTIVSWNGKPTTEDYLAVKGMTLTLSNGAKWVPTAIAEASAKDSGRRYNNMNTLNLFGGSVDITSSDVQVTVDKLNGSGSVNLATDLNAQEGQQAGTFTVANAKEGSMLSVNLMDTKLEKQLTADEINADQAKKLMANVGGKDADGKNVVSTSTAVPEGMVNPAFGVDAEGKTHEASANTLMQSSLELASAAPLALNRIMMNDVRKRLGDIRTTEGTHGAWARYDGGKLSGQGGLENDFHTVQVGIDTVPTADSARMGVAFSYTDSEAEYARGSADMKAYSIAMYGTKVFDNGMFVDVIGRMGTADSDLTVDGQHKGTLDNVVLGVSGEFGWRFDVTNSMYIEPQAELSYAYVNGDKLTLGTAEYDVDSVNSLLGRVGFAAGLKCPSDMGNVYVRASAVHEFLGDSKITGANAGHTNVYEIDGKDTWVEYGLGANFNVTKSTYMWADVERTSGGALDEDWRATVGVRYAW